MAATDIDPDVRSLIHEKIDSVEHLEILLLLKANAGRRWTPLEVVAALRNDLDSARLRLNDLSEKGLLKSDSKSENPGDSLYFYAPRDTSMSKSVDKLVQAYSERRVSVINLIFSKPLERIQVFANAFKLRKD